MKECEKFLLLVKEPSASPRYFKGAKIPTEYMV